MKEAEEEEGASRKTSRSGSKKNQIIIEMDEETWRDIIKTGNLKKPWIEHRAEEHQQISGSKGWYS